LTFCFSLWFESQKTPKIAFQCLCSDKFAPHYYHYYLYKIGIVEGRYKIDFNISNLASSTYLSDHFEVLTPIKNPTLTLDYPGKRNSTEILVEYGVNITYIIALETGSNVLIEVFYGDEDDLEVPTTALQLNGSWSGPLRFEHFHEIPGDFEVTFVVSNAASKFILAHNITVITSCKGLILSQIESPVVYKPMGGVASFQFNYGEQKAGASCRATIWPGDGNSYGPFLINVNFKGNFTRNAIQFKYLSTGRYNVKFFVENRLDNETYEATVDVVYGVHGLILDTGLTSLATNESFDLNAYLIQGSDTNITYYDWSFNGETQTTIRTGTCCLCNLK
jgi:hypothetical protein